MQCILCMYAVTALYTGNEEAAQPLREKHFSTLQAKIDFYANVLIFSSV